LRTFYRRLFDPHREVSGSQQDVMCGAAAPFYRLRGTLEYKSLKF
jgi:hypothetical protein